MSVKSEAPTPNSQERFERLLERGFRGNAVPGDGCPDAEMLAAWADGKVTAAEGVALEAHAADCGHCVAVLSALSRTAPVPPDQGRGAWHPMRWLVPLAAAAIAITTWSIVQQAPQEPSAPAAESVAAPPAPERKADAPHVVATPALPPPLPKDARDNRALADAAPPSALQRQERVDELAQLRAAGSAAGNAQPVIVSPDPNVRWRLTGGSIERSADAGVSWQAQSVESAGTLAAGSSPAPNVCWIVGAGGVVLLTTDGSTWRRLEIPGKPDLVAVTATDAQTAVVTTSNGRTFRTVNGGQIWTAQEIPAAPF